MRVWTSSTEAAERSPSTFASSNVSAAAEPVRDSASTVKNAARLLLAAAPTARSLPVAAGRRLTRGVELALAVRVERVVRIAEHRVGEVRPAILRHDRATGEAHAEPEPSHEQDRANGPGGDRAARGHARSAPRAPRRR